MTEPKEHPMLFSAPMIRALLAGHKRQSRRIIKPQPKLNFPSLAMVGTGKDEGYWKLSPADKPVKIPWRAGDLIWARETFVLEATGVEYEARIPTDRPYKECDDGCVLVPHYRATEPEPHIVPFDDMTDDVTKWKPSIFMPQWACRIWLEVKAVRCERLQSISEADAEAEGIDVFADGCGWSVPGACWKRNPVDAFADLWELVHGKGAWELNPWVAVIEFGRVDKP